MSTPQNSIAFSKSQPRRPRGASTEFPYATLGQGEALLPTVEVKVALASGSVFPFRMLPDSGASRSVFPAKYAKPLGIELGDCDVQTVDTGNGLAKQHLAPTPLRAWIAGREVEPCACFGNIGVPVLGREDFFAVFYVEVDEKSRAVVITPHE